MHIDSNFQFPNRETGKFSKHSVEKYFINHFRDYSHGKVIKYLVFEFSKNRNRSIK